jgi:hypothetical protein
MDGRSHINVCSTSALQASAVHAFVDVVSLIWLTGYSSVAKQHDCAYTCLGLLPLLTAGSSCLLVVSLVWKQPLRFTRTVI